MDLKKHIMTFLEVKSTMKINLIITLFLLITSNLYANLDFIKLEDFDLEQSETESFEEVSNDMTVLKNTEKSTKQTFEYTLKTHFSAIDNVELTPQSMHRFAYYNHENNLYGFISVGTYAETTHNQIFSYRYTYLSRFSSVYYTSTFRPIIAGVGFFLKHNSYQYTFEFAYQSYYADTGFSLSDTDFSLTDTDFSLNGILFGVGLKKYFSFLNNFGFHANFNFNFGTLSTLYVNDKTYKLDSRHGTLSLSAGIGLNLN